MIYVASPYSHFDRSVMHARFQTVLRATAIWLNEGQFVYSPIVHCHEAANTYALRHDFEFWQDYNRHMLMLAGDMWVLDVDNDGSYGKSKGVSAEMAFAEACDIPVTVWRFNMAGELKELHA